MVAASLFIVLISGRHQDRPKVDLKLLEKQMVAVMDAEQKACGFPGATATVILPDGSGASVAVGYSEGGTPMKPNDRMLAGSIGKTFFAATMLQLAKEKNIDLDTKIEKWLGKEPWFSHLPNHGDITLRQLMHHQSGLPDHLEVPALMKKLLDDPNHEFTGAELVNYVADMPALFPAGSKFAYADLNFILVAMIIENITHRKAYDEINRRLIGPLKLRDTMPSIHRKMPGLIQGNSKPNAPFTTKGPVIKDGELFLNPQMEWGGGGFLSNTKDLATWAKALYSGNVLSKELLKEYTTGVPSFRGEEYGLGCQLRPSPWGITQGHSGWFPGYLSDMVFFPTGKFSIGIQFNTDDISKLKGMPYRMVLLLAKEVANDLNLKGG